MKPGSSADDLMASDHAPYAANTRPMKYADGGRLITALVNA